jgi:membrane-bound lytic murein transglycosylase D
VVLNKENQPNMSEVKGGAEKQVVLHQMKANDTLSKIAKQYQVPVQSIMQWNKISDQRKVKKGQQITLHLDRPAPEAMTILAGMPKAAVGMKQSAATKTVAEPQNAANIPLLADNKKQPSVASAATAKASAAQAPMKSSVAQTPAAKAPVVAPQTAKAVAAAPRTAQTAVAKAPQASGANPPVNQTTKDAPTWYVVKTGDTLYNIAKRYQVSAQDLKKWNNLSSNALDIGNKLVVKKS